MAPWALSPTPFGQATDDQYDQKPDIGWAPVDHARLRAWMQRASASNPFAPSDEAGRAVATGKDRAANAALMASAYLADSEAAAAQSMANLLGQKTQGDEGYVVSMGFTNFTPVVQVRNDRPNQNWTICSFLIDNFNRIQIP